MSNRHCRLKSFCKLFKKPAKHHRIWESRNNCNRPRKRIFFIIETGSLSKTLRLLLELGNNCNFFQCIVMQVAAFMAVFFTYSMQLCDFFITEFLADANKNYNCIKFITNYHKFINKKLNIISSL